jgi:hypothetical protein
VLAWANDNGNGQVNFCLASTMDNVAQSNQCPTSQATAAAGANGVTWGPANRAMTITSLFAFTPDAFTAGQNVTVAVLVNGVSSALTCTVTGPGNSCTSSATVSLNPGDFLAVQLQAPATGAFVQATWRVSFSYG